MKKIILLILLFISIPNIFALELESEEEIYIPEDITWTERFILSELKELRSNQEVLKREIFTEIQSREIGTIDKALSYSANTVNFFFVLLTILIAGFGVVGWKTIGDIKNATKESMDRETKKIIGNFQKKIEELEKEQKINIFWRQFNTADTDKEKINILDRIYFLKPESQFVTIEKSNVYLSMGLYEKVIEVTDSIIHSERAKHQPQALFNRACAFNLMGDKDNTLSALSDLLHLSPDYKSLVGDTEHLASFIKNSKIKDLLK